METATQIHPIVAELVERRKLLGLSQLEISRRTGMWQSAIGEMETGVTPNPTLRTVTRYAQAVNMLLTLSEVPS